MNKHLQAFDSGAAGRFGQFTEVCHAAISDSARRLPPLNKEAMKTLIRMSAIIHALITVIFVAAAIVLIITAVNTGLRAVLNDGFNASGAQGVIEALGLLTVAVVALQIAQTIGEEEVIREAHISGPTRVRRFLSRFMTVIVVAVAIEGLVATFKAMREDLGLLPYAASLLVGVSFLLASWGLFIRWNRYAEELEPEAMKQAKQEDRKLD
jgi:large-conductance mechanosensitive channel